MHSTSILPLKIEKNESFCNIKRIKIRSLFSLVTFATTNTNTFSDESKNSKLSNKIYVDLRNNPTILYTPYTRRVQNFLAFFNINSHRCKLEKKNYEKIPKKNFRQNVKFLHHLFFSFFFFKVFFRRCFAYPSSYFCSTLFENKMKVWGG